MAVPCFATYSFLDASGAVIDTPADTEREFYCSSGNTTHVGPLLLDIYSGVMIALQALTLWVDVQARV